MSRAKDQNIVRSSQKVFRVVTIAGLIVVAAIAIFTIKAMLATKDHDARTAAVIMNEQKAKAEKKRTSPYREQMERLRAESEKRVLSKEETDNLKHLQLLISKIKEDVDAEYRLIPSESARASKATQKFIIPACDDNDECEEVPTVDAGPGTLHRLRGDAPYRAISVQLNGKRIPYNMPAGWESWTGDAPAGKLWLKNTKGAKSPNLVEITRAR